MSIYLSICLYIYLYIYLSIDLYIRLLTDAIIARAAETPMVVAVAVAEGLNMLL